MSFAALLIPLLWDDLTTTNASYMLRYLSDLPNRSRFDLFFPIIALTPTRGTQRQTVFVNTVCIL